MQVNVVNPFIDARSLKLELSADMPRRTLFAANLVDIPPIVHTLPSMRLWTVHPR